MSTTKLDIVLIGPYGSGKTTLAECLKRRLGWTHFSLDQELHNYLKKLCNYSEVAEQLADPRSTPRSLQPHYAYMVERFFHDLDNRQENCVIDFGYNHSLYEDAMYFERIKRILDPYPNVFLLMPSPDEGEAVCTLLSNIKSKGTWLSDNEINEMNSHAVRLYAKHNLAKLTNYTKGKSPPETCDELYQKVQLPT